MPYFKIAFVLFLIFSCCGIGFGQTITRLDDSKITAAALDKKIEQLMAAGKVHGLAISVFNKNEPVYKKTFGYKRVDTKAKLEPQTNLYGASLSKAVFAVLVMKLVEEGKLDLDKPLQSYLDKPIYEYTPKTKWHDNFSDLRSDSLYHKITARMCLAHTAGFANWRWDEKDQKLRVNFEPGTRYSYSGEGMVYLQVVLEKMLNKPLETLMQEKIFGPLKMQQSAYSFKPAFEQNYAWGHQENGAIYEKDKDNEPRSASTLETTLHDYTLFTEGVLKHKIISAASTKQMFTPQLRLRSQQQFGPFRFKETDQNDKIELSNGLGWILLKSPHGTGAFKEGHGNGFQHYSILFPERGIGMVIMTNSDNGESIFKELLEFAIGDTYTPWYWENYIPYHQKQ